MSYFTSLLPNKADLGLWRDAWYQVIAEPWGLPLHILAFAICGFFLRKLFNTSNSPAADAKLDGTSGLSIVMYFALFIGFFEVEALRKLLSSGVAVTELFIAIAYGLLHEVLTFKDKIFRG